jgi:NAD+ synthase (glutamine-hydrolysing)
MKIAIAQLNFTIGDFEQNTIKILNVISKAGNDVDLLIFSELALCGYPPDDLLHYSGFEQRQQHYLNKIIQATGECIVVLGALEKNLNKTGRPYFNTAYVLQNGKIIDKHQKSLLPDYDVFNEERHFERGELRHVTKTAKGNIAVTICEDIWHDLPQRTYIKKPLSEMLSESEADFFINISASPFSIGKQSERLNLMKRRCKEHELTGIYVNQVGGNTDLIFDGRSFVMNSSGELCYESPAFEEDYHVFELDKLKPVAKNQEYNSNRLIHEALVCGIRDYFHKNGFTKAVLGSSGGIDSAVVQALASKALGSENVTALIMPSEFSTQHSLDDAILLSKNLNNPYILAPIKDLNNSFLETMKQVYGETAFGLTEENIQSRIRGNVLMAYSNKKGHLLLNTSNKSELAVGYGTLYGDMCGALSVIGDIYKMQVYELAKWMNRNRELIPQNIIDKAPSAELRPNQKDSDSLPDYELLDKIIKCYVEEGLSNKEIVEIGFDEKIVSQTIKMINQNEHKRFQAPPILRVSKRSFGRGRAIPLASKFDF